MTETARARILVVDDDRASRDLMAKILRQDGYEIDRGLPTAPRPSPARAPRPGREPIDLVVSDIRMVEADGLEVLKAFRARQPRHAGDPGDRLRQRERRAPGRHPPGRLRLPLEALRGRRHQAGGGPGAAAETAGRGEPHAAPRGAREVQAREHRRAQRGHAAGLQDRRARRRHRRHGAHPGRERHGQGAAWRAPSTSARRARRGPSSPSTAARSPRRARERALRPRARAPSPARRWRAAASSRRPTAARSSSTRSATSRPKLQAKLLRVLQEGEVRPVGQNEPVSVDVRVVAATNRDLELRRCRRAASARTSSTGSTWSPSASRRCASAPRTSPLLAEHFVRKHGRSRDRRPLAPRPASVLAAYRWPGNVRELENVIARALALNPSRRDPPRGPARLTCVRPSAAAGARATAAPASKADRPSPRLERRYAELVLQETRRQQEQGRRAAGHRPQDARNTLAAQAART